MLAGDAAAHVRVYMVRQGSRPCCTICAMKQSIIISMKADDNSMGSIVR